MRADGRSAYYGGITLWVLSARALIVYFANRPDRFVDRPVAVATQAAWDGVLRPVPLAAPGAASGRALDARLGGGMADRRRRCVLLAACTVVSWFLVERPALALKEPPAGALASALVSATRGLAG